MIECYFNQCPHHHKDEPFCKVDTCLVSEEQFSDWRLERMGYDLEELEKDNPYNQWMREE